MGFLLLRSPLARSRRLLLPTIRVECLLMRLSVWFKKLRDSRLRMKPTRVVSKQRTVLRTMPSKSGTALTMRSLLVNLVRMTNLRSMMPFFLLPPGWMLTKMLRRKSSRPNRRSSRAYVFQFFKVLEVVLGVCLEVCLICLEVCPVDSQVEHQVEPLLPLKPTRDQRSKRLTKFIDQHLVRIM